MRRRRLRVSSSKHGGSRGHIIVPDKGDRTIVPNPGIIVQDPGIIVSDPGSYSAGSVDHGVVSGALMRIRLNYYTDPDPGSGSKEKILTKFKCSKFCGKKRTYLPI